MEKNGGENVSEFIYGNITNTYPFFIQINIAPIDISAYAPVKTKCTFPDDFQITIAISSGIVI